MRSIFLLGKDTNDEWRLADQLGGSPNTFFRATQRIAWGVTQPDLIRVDVLDTAKKLVASHGSAFPAQLFAAWVWRARDPDRAERFLERARALASPDHPLIGLLPTDAEWRLDRAAQQLVTIHPERMWRVVHHFPMAGSPLLHDTIATVIRLASGELAIINPVAFEPAIAQQIRALGEVRWLISQGKGHSLFVEPSRVLFPGSIAIGTPGHLTHPSASHLRIDGVLGTAKLPDELAVLPIEGHLFEEVMLLDRPSKTLIAQDVFALAGDQPFVSRLYAFAWGSIEAVGYLSFSLLMWQSMPALHRSLAAVRGEPFAHVIGAHGVVAPRSGDALRVQALIDHTRGITNLGHKAMLARLFTTQPSFLRDLIVYLRSSKNQRGAQLRASHSAA